MAKADQVAADECVSEQVQTRFTPSMLKSIDDERERMQAELHGVVISRSDAVRALVALALDVRQSRAA